MPVFEDDQDNLCEGCMVRNTGDNFHCPALCKACMGSILEAPEDDVLKGQDKLTDRMEKNAVAKVGAFTSWRDTDGAEVEITLPLPPGIGKKDVRVKANVTKLLVAAGERKLLFVDPLYDDIVPAELVWCIEPALDGGYQMQISLAKYHPGTRWGKTLARDDGVLEYWRANVLAAPLDVSPTAARATTPTAPTAGGMAVAEAEAEAKAGAPEAPDPSSVAKDGKPKPKFTLRDDGAEVEVNLPLPLGTGTGKKDVKVDATATKLRVAAGARTLLHVEPLVAPIYPDDLVYTVERSKGSEQVHLQITLAKADEGEGAAWTTLVKEGGRFECWTAEM